MLGDAGAPLGLSVLMLVPGLQAALTYLGAGNSLLVRGYSKLWSFPPAPSATIHVAQSSAAAHSFSWFCGLSRKDRGESAASIFLGTSESCL